MHQSLPFRDIPEATIDLWRPKASAACVIIPVVNEGERIRSLAQRMSAQGISAACDVIIVDGGSSDGSLDRAFLEPLRVRGVIRKTGPGKLSAQLRCGYACALDEGYSAVVTIDGNDKDDPDAIPAFVAALGAGADFVQASRFVPGGVAENTPWVRDVAIRLIHAPLLSLASGFHWTDTTQGFRGYSRRLLEDPRVAPFRPVFDRYELLAYMNYCAPRLGYRCVEIPTARRYPADGKVPTKISTFRGNWLVMKTLVKACLGHYGPLPQRPGTAPGADPL